MVKKFDGTIWKWLLANVMGKLLPTPASAGTDAGKVPTVQADGSYALEEAGGGLPSTTAEDSGKVYYVGSEGEITVANYAKIAVDGRSLTLSSQNDPIISTLTPSALSLQDNTPEMPGEPYSTYEGLVGSNYIAVTKKNFDGSGTFLNQNQISIFPDSITSRDLLTPTSNKDFVQKGYVDDAIAAAIAQLKADNPTLN